VTATSIVITNHDHGRFVGEAIDSALAYPDYRTGDHREQGAFWITGPGVAARALASPVSITDFAPAIGALLGVPLPGLDGRPIPGV
jgi:predicted AlkP superfamily phosphohydrolase/phosphomutase